MKKKRWIIITAVIILFLGYLFGSSRIDEAAAWLTMRMGLNRTLDYYEYHWRGNRKSELLSMCFYSYQKQGTQRKCLEYISDSPVEAVLNSYSLTGYDSQGNLVYQKRLEAQGSSETYWFYTYDEQGRIAERAAYEEGAPWQLERYHYYENGMSACALQFYQNGSLNPESTLMVLYDEEGRELLRKYDGDSGLSQGADLVTLQPGPYGREDLVCEGERLAAYRWYDYMESGNISFMLEITPADTVPVEYLCTYFVFNYDKKNRLTAVYQYRPTLDTFPDYINFYRHGDVYTGIYIHFDSNGQMEEIKSVYFTDENHPGVDLYSIFLQEDGTYILEME